MGTADHTQGVFARAFSGLGRDLSLAVLCRERPFPLGLVGNLSASLNSLSSGQTRHLLLSGQAAAAVLHGVWCWEAGRRWSLWVKAVSRVTPTDLYLCKHRWAACVALAVMA